MMELEDAWRWYEATSGLLGIVERLGAKYWDDLPWAGLLEKDERFKPLDAESVAADSRSCSEHLEDFAVLILFSAFESSARQIIRSEAEGVGNRIESNVVRAIVEGALDDIEHGSFARVVKLSGIDHTGLAEEVNQVRRYRNWVAHGRRGDRPAAVDPRTAYERLRRFLDRLAPPESAPRA